VRETIFFSFFFGRAGCACGMRARQGA
jgi:hypothetical protein